MFMTFSSPSKEQEGRKYSAMFMYRASWARTSFVAEILLASHLVVIRIHHQSHCVWENKLTVSQDWRIKLVPVKCQKHIGDPNLLAMSEEKKTHFRSSNILPSPTYATCFDPPNTVESHIPCMLNQVLQLQDCRHTLVKMTMIQALGSFDVRNEHLYVSIAAKATLSRHLEDMSNFGTTEKSTLDGSILVAQAREHWNDTNCFILDG